MGNLICIAQLTFLEARRRRIVLAALVCSAACLMVFASAVYLIQGGHRATGPLGPLQTGIQLQLLSLAGFYAVNLLTVAVSIILPLDTVSGEIASGVMQTLASKPIRRTEILLGKWLVFLLIVVAYVAIMVTGVVLAMRLVTGFAQSHAITAAMLIALQAVVILCVVMAAGVRVSITTSAIIAFAFYAVAVIGGWIEQIGVMVGNANARYIGTAISLVSPTDALWRRAVHLLQPPLMTEVQVNQFTPASVPSMAMVWWSVAFSVGALALALRWFEKRAL